VKLLNLNIQVKIKIIIKEENFKWHLEAFASELFDCNDFKHFSFKINLKLKLKSYVLYIEISALLSTTKDY